MIVLNETNQLKLYIHEKGEEFFLHYDYWPFVPFTYQPQQKDIWVDVNLRKEVFNGVIINEKDKSLLVSDQVQEKVSDTSDYFGKKFSKVYYEVLYTHIVKLKLQIL